MRAALSLWKLGLWHGSSVQKAAHEPQKEMCSKPDPISSERNSSCLFVWTKTCHCIIAPLIMQHTLCWKGSLPTSPPPQLREHHQDRWANLYAWSCWSLGAARICGLSLSFCEFAKDYDNLWHECILVLLASIKSSSTMQLLFHCPRCLPESLGQFKDELPK